MQDQRIIGEWTNAQMAEQEKCESRQAGTVTRFQGVEIQTCGVFFYIGHNMFLEIGDAMDFILANA